MVKHPFVVGALGDSITTAFNAHAPRDNLGHSWSTGLDVAGPVSHAARIREALSHADVQTHNVAVSGARASALSGQVARLVPHAPDYVTLLIGANDLVSLTGATLTLLQSYKADVEAAVKRLIEANRRVLAVIAGIPNQAHLLQLMPVPSPAFVEPLRRMYLERWEAFNEALAGIARQHSANVRYAPSIALAKFEAKHLSALDSYHPSLAGQRLLADLSWKEGWF